MRHSYFPLLLLCLSSCSLVNPHYQEERQMRYAILHADAPQGIPTEVKPLLKKQAAFAQQLFDGDIRFDADISRTLDSLSISMVQSNDGQVRIFYWDKGMWSQSWPQYYCVCQTAKHPKGFVCKNIADFRPIEVVALPANNGATYYAIRAANMVMSHHITFDLTTVALTRLGRLQPAHIIEAPCEDECSILSFYAEKDAAPNADIPLVSYVSVDNGYSHFFPSFVGAGGWLSGDKFYQTCEENGFPILYMPLCLDDNLLGEHWKGLQDWYIPFNWNGSSLINYAPQPNPFLSKHMPEDPLLNMLLVEFRYRRSIIRIELNELALRYLAWDADHMYSKEPDLIISDGWYEKSKERYYFRNKGYQYIYDILTERFTIIQNGEVIVDEQIKEPYLFNYYN